MEARVEARVEARARTAVARSQVISSLVLLFLAVMRLPSCCDLITSPVLRAPGPDGGEGRQRRARCRGREGVGAPGAQVQGRLRRGAREGDDLRRCRLLQQRRDGGGEGKGGEGGGGQGWAQERRRLHEGLLGAFGLVTQPDLVAHLDLGCDWHFSAPARARPRSLSSPVP